MALPTVNIKGKEYTMVKDRILFFNATYPNGSITTAIVSSLEAERVIVYATVVPDVANPNRVFGDYSQAVVGEGLINKTAALENASTSAVGRALAMMGIGVIESVASAEEIKKTTHLQPAQWNKPINTPAQTATVLKAVTTKATDFPYGNNAKGENPEITDADIPDFGATQSNPVVPLQADAAAVADHLIHFQPLSEKRNAEIQGRLGELVKDKTLVRRKLQTFLDKEHDGKRSIEVSSEKWEHTMAKIEKAVSEGADSVRELFKKDANGEV